MRVSRCVKTDFGYVGCYADVMAYMHDHCSGQQECRVRIPETHLDAATPCNDELKSYLDVDFICVSSKSKK